MGVQFVRKPADGSLPFIAAGGHDIVEVMRTLKRFSTIANGGDVADEIHLHPVQIRAIEERGLSLTQVIEGPVLNDEEHLHLLTHLPEKKFGGLRVVPDLEVLPTEGVLYKGSHPLAIIRGLPLPFSKPETDEVAKLARETEQQAQHLKDEAAELRSIAESLEKRAETLLS